MNPESYNKDNMAGYAHQYNSGLDAIGVTKHFLIDLRPTP